MWQAGRGLNLEIYIYRFLLLSLIQQDRAIMDLSERVLTELLFLHVAFSAGDTLAAEVVDPFRSGRRVGNEPLASAPAAYYTPSQYSKIQFVLKCI